MPLQRRLRLRTLRSGEHCLRPPDTELGQWVTGSVGHLGHLSRPGHRVIILTRCDTRVYPVLEKKPAQDKDIKICMFFCENPSNRH